VDQQQQVAVVIRALGEPGDLGWVVMAHGELYAAEFGWDASFEALVARIVADYASSNSPGKDAAWLAELDGRRVGCVFCVRTSDQVAQLRILLVNPQARGRSVGRRLVEQCVHFARDSGYRELVLWTNDPLVSARRLYLAAGFRLVQEQPHVSFGAQLVGQSYTLDLTSPAASQS